MISGWAMATLPLCVAGNPPPLMHFVLAGFAYAGLSPPK